MAVDLRLLRVLDRFVTYPSPTRRKSERSSSPSGAASTTSSSAAAPLGRRGHRGARHRWLGAHRRLGRLDSASDHHDRPPCHCGPQGLPPSSCRTRDLTSAPQRGGLAGSRHVEPGSPLRAHDQLSPGCVESRDHGLCNLDAHVIDGAGPGRKHGLSDGRELHPGPGSGATLSVSRRGRSAVTAAVHGPITIAVAVAATLHPYPHL